MKSYLPSEVHNMIQRPRAGDKLENTILGEINLVSSVNTPITVQIVQGDLVQENTDGIINPTDQFG